MSAESKKKMPPPFVLGRRAYDMPVPKTKYTGPMHQTTQRHVGVNPKNDDPDWLAWKPMGVSPRVSVYNSTMVVWEREHVPVDEDGKEPMSAPAVAGATFAATLLGLAFLRGSKKKTKEKP